MAKTKLPSDMKNQKQSYLQAPFSIFLCGKDTRKKGFMPSNDVIYHMAANIYASGHTTIKQAAEYAVKLAGLVDAELSSKNQVTPKCFLSNPDARERAENGCLNCKHNDACFADLAKK